MLWLKHGIVLRRVLHMHEGNIPKMAFHTHLGYYEFVIMLIGLTNELATFLATMNKIFQPYLWKFITVFYDIMVYNQFKEEHLNHL